MTTEDPKTEIEVPKSRAPEPTPDARRRKLRKIGGLLAGFAAVGTVLAGLTGYWTTYRTVTKEIFSPVKPGPIAPPLSVVVCAFRRSRPGIPSEGGRLYRLKPAGDSDDPGHLLRRALVSTSSSGQLAGSASSL